MENLSPQVEVLAKIRMGLERNRSVLASLNEIGDLSATEFGHQIQEILKAHQQGGSVRIDARHSQLSHSIYHLIQRSLAGESVVMHLQELEQEALRDGFDQIDVFTKRLPFLLMMPLFVFLFPALAVLMLTPLILSLLRF